MIYTSFHYFNLENYSNTRYMVFSTQKLNNIKIKNCVFGIGYKTKKKTGNGPNNTITVKIIF
jgi:hypothetical protein